MTRLFGVFRRISRTDYYEQIPKSAQLGVERKRRLLIVAARIFAVLTILLILGIFVSYKRPDNLFSSSSSPGRSAVFTTLYTNAYALGAATLGHSILRANVNASLVLLYLDDRVSSQALCITEAAGWENHAVSLISPPHGGEGIFYRFVDQYTKLRVWSVGEVLGFDSAVYLDADTLVRRNFDELFGMPWEFGATTDVYLDDRKFAITFNAGVLAFRPSMRTFDDMVGKLEKTDYPLGEAEQGFLNVYYRKDMVRLPYTYNANLATKYADEGMWNELKETMKVVHYTLVKPFWNTDIANDNLTTPEQVRGINGAEGANQWWREEMGWWREVFEDLMNEKGAAIQACYQ
ncbi:hypothetical protein D9758_008444 [Tetrapyrgos nigripes]|uniref:Nucleotide-diphospho-sugar transferase n=1 Tax=Tetrapyrgos nigripes TaxID=182062 RepID=A0A8H5CQ65_9AGAR|nr:hypothetical protein D9758_008444 [Tetrapyrgos nigripes]